MKIQIIGASGTGKTTLGRLLSEQTGTPFIDCDSYLWADADFTVQHPVEKRLEMYLAHMVAGRYVAAGSIYAWQPQGFADRELLVFLRLDEASRMARLRRRELERYGPGRFSLDEQGQITNDFLRWCQTYLTGSEDEMSSYRNHLLQLRLARCPTLELDAGLAPGVLADAVLAAWQGLSRDDAEGPCGYNLSAQEPHLALRPAVADDLPQVQAMYREIVRCMAAGGLHIWDEVYPSAFLGADIEAGRLYLLTPGGGLAAAFALCGHHGGADLVTWRGAGRAVYLDRLGVSPAFQRAGVGSAALKAAMDTARRMGAQHLRLFVVESNAPAIALYQKTGFVQAGGLYEERIDDLDLTLCQRGYEIQL